MKIPSNLHVRRNYRDLALALSDCLSCRDHSRQRETSRGFSLLELMIAMSVGLIVLGAVYSVFTLQNKQFANQDVAVEMQQNARMAMDIITREIRMAGYNPTRTGSGSILPTGSGSLMPDPISTTYVGIRNAAADTISFALDINGNGDLTAGSANPNENIVYDRYESPSGSGIYALGRTSNGNKQPVIQYLDSLGFEYFKADGSAATDLANIRTIRVTIRTIAAKPDPSYTTNNGFRTYTLTSTVTSRNLGY
ncbi:MAG: prepilin-type N-terminal cleavage/methylation domain-containing protein [Syntrophales bacterium LBB04]|nr:prepilin-type N-terminal cleavage/methylation domain-containing protein [Syntrophales bacterium LBB04]